jgi:hypothetical protein
MVVLNKGPQLSTLNCLTPYFCKTHFDIVFPSEIMLPYAIQIFRPNASNSTPYTNTLTMSRAIPTALHKQITHQRQSLSHDCPRKHEEAVLIPTTCTRRSIQTRNWTTRKSHHWPLDTPNRRHDGTPGITHWTGWVSPIAEIDAGKTKENICFCRKLNPNSTVIDPLPVSILTASTCMDCGKTGIKVRSVQRLSGPRLKHGTSPNTESPASVYRDL